MLIRKSDKKQVVKAEHLSMTAVRVTLKGERAIEISKAEFDKEYEWVSDE